MKAFLAVMGMALLISVAHAAQDKELLTAIPREMIEEGQLRVRVDLPCNWIPDLGNLEFVGVYGSEQMPSSKEPVVASDIMKAQSQNPRIIFVSFDAKSMTSTGLAPLKQMEVHGAVSKARCPQGFGFGILSK